MPEYVYSIVFIVIIGVVVMLWNKKREDDVWEVGDRAKKVRGEFFPSKI